jgi:hypothetical protein
MPFKKVTSIYVCYHLGIMLSSGANVIIWDEILSSGMKCYHLKLILSSGAYVIVWSKCYHVGGNVIICKQMLSSGQFCAVQLPKKINVIIWCHHVVFLPFIKVTSKYVCYHLELMLSSGANVIMWDEKLSVMKCYHLELILSYEANVNMCNKCFHVGGKVIMCCKVPKEN